MCSAAADEPVLILCDLRFGTPHNAALRVASERPLVRVLAGLNLAMALEASLSQDTVTTMTSQALDTWVDTVRSAGLQDIGV